MPPGIVGERLHIIFPLHSLFITSPSQQFVLPASVIYDIEPVGQVVILIIDCFLEVLVLEGVSIKPSYSEF
jgi:hypothetical protein